MPPKTVIQKVRGEAPAKEVRSTLKQPDSSDQIDHLLSFKNPSPEEKAAFLALPGVVDHLGEDFTVSFEDLRGDSQVEAILLAGSDFCGTGGCSALVLDSIERGRTVLFSGGVPDSLGVTKETYGGIKALAGVDQNGRILMVENESSENFRKPMIYFLRVR